VNLEESRLDLVFAAERASATPRMARHAPRTPSIVREGRRDAPLAEVQAWFQKVVTDRADPDPDAIATLVRPGAQLTPGDAVGVYRYAYRARLVECLADDYPALKHALGEATFGARAEAYVDAYPPRSKSLNFYGRHMAAFCGTWADPESAFYADLARLEWALVEILHAEDAPPLAAEQLATMAPETWAQAKLLPSATFRLCRFAYPANAYFQAFKDDGAPPIPAPAPHALAVYRQGFTLWRMDLTPAMADLLEDLATGHALGEVLGRMETRLDAAALAEATTQVMAWFSAWVRGGFFRAVKIG